jgi:hypothetical protein
MPWTGTRGPGPPVHGGPPKGYAAPFNLDRPPRSDGPDATQAAAETRGGRRRSSPVMANLASRAPNLTGDGPKARGGQKELTGGLGKEGGAPEERISGKGGAPAVALRRWRCRGEDEL